ncbi:hypothetical protein GCM10011405_27170 [Rufibacter glacialis]|nr:hypothetical protein GCM10011405_27170 [Rufibacter glacialis]
MDTSKQIIAVASRYGVVIQHMFSDLYSAIRFLKKGEREGKHFALGAFDPVSGVVYTLEKEAESCTSRKVVHEKLSYFLELGLKASSVKAY